MPDKPKRKIGRPKKPGPKKGTGQVPAPERALMLKMFYGGATYPEIAKAFGRHRNTVMRIAHRFKWKDKIKAHEERRSKTVMTEADYEKKKTIGIYQNVEAALANELAARMKSSKSKEFPTGKTGVKADDTIKWLLAVGDQKLKTMGVDVSGRPRGDDVPPVAGHVTNINVQNLIMMREAAQGMNPEELRTGIDRLRKSIGILEAKEATAVTVDAEQGGDDD